jgi:hypothetical protein
MSKVRARSLPADGASRTAVEVDMPNMTSVDERRAPKSGIAYRSVIFAAAAALIAAAVATAIEPVSSGSAEASPDSAERVFFGF